MFIKKIRAIVINLEKDVEKLQGMLQELDALKIAEYEILKAIPADRAEIRADGKAVLFEDRVYDYGIYSGRFPFRKEYLSKREIGCALSNHIARNNQMENYYTIVFEDDARYIADKDAFKFYINNLPERKDYDIIFLSDCTWSSTPYRKLKSYNNYYYYLPRPYFDISGTHAYIINPGIGQLLNRKFTFKLAADDYLNYCINKFKLRALVANEVLFTQRPQNYIS